MDHTNLQQVNREIYRKYPEFDGVSPQVQSNSTAQSSAQNGSYILTYRRVVVTANNQKMTRVLRVVVTAAGKIQKISTSR